MGAPAQVIRLPNGRMAPGNRLSNGRPRATPEEREARRLIREGTIKAARRLMRIVEGGDDRLAMAAACAILDRSEIAHIIDDEGGGLSVELGAIEALPLSEQIRIMRAACDRLEREAGT